MLTSMSHTPSAILSVLKEAKLKISRSRMVIACCRKSTVLALSVY